MTEGLGSAAPAGDGADADEVLEAGAARTRWFDRLVAPAAHERTGSPRRRVGVVVLLAMVSIAVAITARLATHRGDHEIAAPPARHDVGQVSMATVRALAEHGGPLGDYVRQSSQAGGCALVAVGTSPQRSIAAAVRKALPGYAVKDVGATLDQFTGLCAIELRAAYRRAVLVVSVASPNSHAARSRYTRVETGIETDGELTTKYALAVNESGWTILLGASGPTAELPRAQDLVQLAQDASLTW